MPFSSASLKYLGGFRTPHDRPTDVTYLREAYPTSGKAADGLNLGGKPFAFDSERRELICGTRYGRAVRLQVIEPVLPTSDVNSLPVAPYATTAIVGLSGPSAQDDPPTDASWFEMNDYRDPTYCQQGGVLPQGDSILVAGQIYYDANNTQRRSVFRARWPSSSPAADYSPERSAFAALGDPNNQGMAAGHFAVVPDEWRERLKGDTLVGQATIPIITRGSAGPCAFSFTASDIGAVDPVPVHLLVGYPNGHPMPGHPWDNPNADEVYNFASQIMGCAMLGDTIAFVGRHGYGLPCYGIGTNDPEEAGQPDGSGGHYCYDPTTTDKGQHCYPYRVQVWHYPLSALAEVAAGLKEPWELVPDWFELPVPFMRPDAAVNGCAYDPTTHRLYVSVMGADGYGYEPGPVIYVYEFVGDALPPDPPDMTECQKAVVALTLALKAEHQRHLATQAQLTDAQQRLHDIHMLSSPPTYVERRSR